MLTTRYKALLNRGLEPVAALVARSGVSPTTITLAGPFLVTAVCIAFLFTRQVLPFCVAVTIAGCADGLDGAVARHTGRVTKFGAYLDAICDRYVEAIAAISVAVVTGYWLLTMVVLVGALLVSYAKARAALEVAVSNVEWPDLMERTERSLCFIAGLAASVLLPWRPLGHDLFWWTLVILSVLIHSTVVQRVLRAQRLILQRGDSAER